MNNNNNNNNNKPKYSTNQEQVLRKIGTHSYSVKLKDDRYKSQLLESIQSLYFIPKITINYLRNEFQLYASTVQTVQEWLTKNGNGRMSYDTSVKMMACLDQQQHILNEKGYSFYTFNTEDLLIIDDNHFICINAKHICSTHEEDNISSIKSTKNNTNIFFNLSTTYSKDDFCSPELQQCRRIPNYTIHISSFYYTFASLIFYCLFGERLSEKNKDAFMNTIIYTPLFWFFQKGLQYEPKERKCFFIS